ncbi:MAG TPA: hypothetical protein VLW54_03580 [Candidatus Acidoferrales bacterium]|nr:hypothetical protein [Candidatus Acidoferrales bacterium]
MTYRHLIIALLAGVLACPPPVLAGGVVGAAGPSEKAIVRGSPLQQGTNIFSGDVVEVGPGGEGVVTFGHNAMARFGADTAVRASRDANTIGLELLRGRMTYRTTSDQPVVGTFADASVRSESGQEAVAIVAFRNPKLVLVTAERGALAVTAGRTHRTVTVPQGQTVEVSLSDDNDPNGGTPPNGQQQGQNTTKPRPSGAMWATGVAMGAGAAVAAGLALSNNQHHLTCPQKAALVSPYVFPCQ